MPKVSVIIPTHNRAEYLRSAITSVLDQTFQDFEMIVVDDASKDNTPNIVKSFANNQIKYLRHHVNKGGAATRNTGIVNSEGKYIAFLDDDDGWLPRKLELQVSLMDQAPAALGALYTGYTMLDKKNGKVLGERIPTSRGNLSEDLFAGNCVGTTSTVLLRRECFTKVGLFDENLASFQDHDMWIRIAREFLFECIEQPLVRYNVHEQKISANLAALQKGTDAMLKKYGQSPIFRRSLAYSYLSLAIQHCEAGSSKESRRAFVKGISLYPFEFRHYFNLVLSFLGPDKFRKLKQAKENILTR